MATTDPDPTTQIAWPSSRKAHDDSPLSPVDQPRNVLQIPEPINRGGNGRSPSPSGRADRKPPVVGKTMLSTWDFIFLSVSMLGAQITWSVELGYVS
jgi:solute carrier family 45 protein 1/2/4